MNEFNFVYRFAKWIVIFNKSLSWTSVWQTFFPLKINFFAALIKYPMFTWWLPWHEHWTPHVMLATVENIVSIHIHLHTYNTNPLQHIFFKSMIFVAHEGTHQLFYFVLIFYWFSIEVFVPIKNKIGNKRERKKKPLQLLNGKIA